MNNIKQSYPEESYADECKRIAEIPEALDHLEKALLYSNDLFGGICDKIGPILSPDLSCETCPATLPEKSVSDLASKIKRFTRIVTEGNEFKTSILQRIEL